MEGNFDNLSSKIILTRFILDYVGIFLHLKKHSL